VIVAVSLRALWRRRGRTLLAVAGIAVSAGLLVDMTMLASGLTRSFGELIREQGFALRVTPRGTLPFDSEAGIRDAASLRSRIAAVPGVTGVAPILGAQLYGVIGDSVTEPFFTTGVDPEAQTLYDLVEGKQPGAAEIIVSKPLAEAYGLAPGSRFQVAPELDAAMGQPRGMETYTVSGVADFVFDYAGERSLAVPLNELQRITGRADEVSLFAVAITSAIEEPAAVAGIQALSDQISVYGSAELMDALDSRLAYFRQLSTILSAIALGVAALLVGTIITIGVRERFGEIATLRAIGVAAYRVQAGIVAQGVALTAFGCLLGLPLGLLMGGRLDKILLGLPGIPARVSFFVFDAAAVTGALLVIVIIGAFAGALPGYGAVKVPLGRALREEAD
jgi:putative ABC transport system permease protein